MAELKTSTPAPAFLGDLWTKVDQFSDDMAAVKGLCIALRMMGEASTNACDRDAFSAVTDKACEHVYALIEKWEAVQELITEARNGSAR